MSKESNALNGLAVMRDQKVVFHNVREIVEDETIGAERKVEKIREFYARHSMSRTDRRIYHAHRTRVS